MMRCLLVTVGFVLLTGAGLCAAPTPVSLTNPGFEQGTEGWHWWFDRPDSVQVSTIAEGAGHCVQFLGTPKSRCAFYQTVPVRPRTWYRVRFRYHAGPKGTSGGVFGSFDTRLSDAFGKDFDYPGPLTLLDTFGQWREAESLLFAPLAAARLQLEFNSHGECDLRVDDVSLEAVDPPAAAPPNTWQQLTQPRAKRLWFSSWQYNLRPGPYRQMAMKYGWQYRWEEQFDLAAADHTTTWAVDDDAFAVMAAKGIPTCEYPYYRALKLYAEHYRGQTQPDMARELDPAWDQCQIEAARQLLAEHGRRPGVAYVFAGDEIFGRYVQSVKPVAERKSPLWATIDADVKARFGGGQFGLPESTDDPTPQRWIAYLSYMGEQGVKTMRGLRQVIAQSGTGAQLIGPDEGPSIYPWPWHELAGILDICAGQSLCYRRTAHQYNTGYVTKCYADFTGKPVHGATQIVMYAGSPSPEEVQRRFSQVLQNGGEGQMLIAEEWGDRELSHHQYAAPERWASVQRMLRLMSTTQVRTPTQSQVGILYSAPSMMAQGPRIDDAPVSSAYALCGPVLGGWPRMVDSQALAAGQKRLDGLAMLIVPYAPFERPEVVAQVRAFAARGGLVVICDPQAFGQGLLGETLDTRDWLAATKPVAAPREMRLSWPAPGRQRVYATEAFALTAPRGGTVVGTYPDGAAAVVRYPVGKGEVLRFGSNPLADETVTDDPEWVAWWRALLVQRKVKLNLPIWQLRLPDDCLVPAEAPADVCVTGNSLVRCQNGAYVGMNDALAGTYTLSVEPDLTPDTGAGPLSFGKGNLTDRLDAPKGPFGGGTIAKAPYREADWADRWSAAAMAQGLVLEFTLPEARQLTRLRFWCSGAMPALQVQAGAAAPVTIAGQMVGEDVIEVAVPLTARADTVKLTFAPGTAPFALAEVELWVQKQ